MTSRDYSPKFYFWKFILQPSRQQKLQLWEWPTLLLGSTLFAKKILKLMKDAGTLKRWEAMLRVTFYPDSTPDTMHGTCKCGVTVYVDRPQY